MILLLTLFFSTEIHQVKFIYIPGKSGVAKDPPIGKESNLKSSVPLKCSPLRETKEDRCDKTQAAELEESDWDSTVLSGQPTPRNEVTDNFDFQTSLGPINTTSKDEVSLY